MSYKTVVFYGSYRQNRQGIKIAHFIIDLLKLRNHSVVFADAKEYGFEILDRMYKEYEPGNAPQKMLELADHIKTADGFLVVGGEYNHSIQPGLSNLMDHFLEEYYFRPSGIITYSTGGFGGARAAIQLRSFLGEIGTVTISSILSIPKISESLDDSGKAKNESLVKKSNKFLDEYEWYVEALKKQKESKGNPF